MADDDDDEGTVATTEPKAAAKPKGRSNLMTGPWPADPTMKLMTLDQMASFLLEIRGDGYMAALGPGGERQPVKEQWRLLSREDLARLTQVVNALNYFSLEEERKRARDKR